MVGLVGVEPTTPVLSGQCSPTELQANETNLILNLVRPQGLEPRFFGNRPNVLAAGRKAHKKSATKFGTVEGIRTPDR